MMPVAIVMRRTVSRRRSAAKRPGFFAPSRTRKAALKEQNAMEDLFGFADPFGPAKIIHIHRPSLNLRAIVVIDNTSCGVAVGGVRMAPDVSTEECFRLARAMTWKNAAAGLAHGGGKSVIFGDARMPMDQKEQLIRAFADAIRDLADYVPGPDMGTNELCMGWIKDETGRAVGLPAAIGGIPLDEIGATGFGLAVCTDVARSFIGLELRGARVVVEGFGAVGKHAARFLAEKGAILVGASDTSGTLTDPAGLDVRLRFTAVLRRRTSPTVLIAIDRCCRKSIFWQVD
jgi:glutamate dehydrogenase (NAD(P)+)